MCFLRKTKIYFLNINPKLLYLNKHNIKQTIKNQNKKNKNKNNKREEEWSITYKLKQWNSLIDWINTKGSIKIRTGELHARSTSQAPKLRNSNQP